MFYTYRNFKNFNMQLFLEDLSRISWDNVFLINNIDSKVDFLTQYLILVFETHAPLCTVRVNKPLLPG